MNFHFLYNRNFFSRMLHVSDQMKFFQDRHVTHQFRFCGSDHHGNFLRFYCRLVHCSARSAHTLDGCSSYNFPETRCRFGAEDSDAGLSFSHLLTAHARTFYLPKFRAWDLKINAFKQKKYKIALIIIIFRVEYITLKLQ